MTILRIPRNEYHYSDNSTTRRPTVAERKLERKSKVLPKIANSEYCKHTGLDWRTEILFRTKQRFFPCILECLFDDNRLLHACLERYRIYRLDIQREKEK